MNTTVVLIKDGSLNTVFQCASAEQGHQVYGTVVYRTELYGEPGQYEISLVLGREITLRQTVTVA